MALSFDATAEEYDLAQAIGERAVRAMPEWAAERQRSQTMSADMPVAVAVEMDVIAVNANGCPLDLQKLLDADDFNFAHDVDGIYWHLDRNTGKLKDCFLPRCARREA